MSEEFTEKGVSVEQFKGWFVGLKNQKRPKKCSLDQAQALLALTHYSKLMAHQLADLRPEHLEKIKVGGKRFVQISFKQKKKTKTVLLPFNKFTAKAFNFCKKFPPGFNCFHSFQSKSKGIALWHKPILVRTIRADGSVSESKEVIKESKPFIRKGSLISNYIKIWTGLSYSVLRNNHKPEWLK